ncbi:hypothetical protein BASA50_006572 [Batrachochytrium salamandrivorans]|uniref:Protein mgr2 n=1 Tax=Batrachochytrium salamandrivorans TaxID=1357716 RepID=A0ABQ8FCR6_9FUNG|nr:hypothetical protein BASA62_009184 [Batrachochytrium salamandrivorans]KAH6577195.1 hypothetical protein BASA60_004129 [Batrachochytrium salamandrivorans]KAH6582915.1 hypothetical protein BASA61_008327 [Batrachochytrium salamandrivorans]KAH6594622.1 hypothetical protein BASA50_006572 [Batrachochytrium salamandrivorans]KAH9252515.1 hypothetical protein BASA81_009558 [Batrachochytrium salamandrivorans]
MIDKAALRQWFEKAKMGFLMGATVGMTTGFIYGTYFVLSVGPPPGKSYIQAIGKNMLQQGSMLGFFLSIGSLLRNEELHETGNGYSSRLPISVLPPIHSQKLKEVRQQ